MSEPNANKRKRDHELSYYTCTEIDAMLDGLREEIEELKEDIAAAAATKHADVLTLRDDLYSYYRDSFAKVVYQETYEGDKFARNIDADMRFSELEQRVECLQKRLFPIQKDQKEKPLAVLDTDEHLRLIERRLQMLEAHETAKRPKFEK